MRLLKAPQYLLSSSQQKKIRYINNLNVNEPIFQSSNARGGGGGGGGGMMKPRIDPRMSKTISMGGTWLLH